jgi:hypothetical protein
MTTKKTGSPEPTYASVWKTLSAIDCTDKAEKKNGLTYLSWAWAWGILMEHYPEATYQFLNEEWDNQGHATVWVSVKIGELDRMMWLPVMDYKNKAIPNPDTRAVSDTRMRCLTKCLAMYGLGHYIYAGEDLPPSGDAAEEKPAPKEKPKAKAKPKAEPKAEAPAEPQRDTIANEEEADGVLSFLCSTADNFAGTTEGELIEWWQYPETKKAADLLDEGYPEHYKQLMAHLSALRASLKESNDE